MLNKIIGCSALWLMVVLGTCNLTVICKWDFANFAFITLIGYILKDTENSKNHQKCVFFFGGGKHTSYKNKKLELMIWMSRRGRRRIVRRRRRWRKWGHIEIAVLGNFKPICLISAPLCLNQTPQKSNCKPAPRTTWVWNLSTFLDNHMIAQFHY